MSDGTPPERAESFQRTMRQSFSRSWRNGEQADWNEYWVAQNARWEMQAATEQIDRATGRRRQ